MNNIQVSVPTSPEPFPLWALLALYERGSSADLFPNYMEGMELLVSFLSPIEIPNVSRTTEQVPKLLRNYELNRIAEMVDVHPYVVYYEYNTLLHHPYLLYPPH